MITKEYRLKLYSENKKWCNVCKTPLPLELFTAGRSYCKPCVKITGKIWRIKNAKRQYEVAKIWANNNITRKGFYQYVSTCRKDNILPWMTHSEFVEWANKRCIYCNGYFPKGKGYGHGMDRIDNSKLHTQDNVVRCCDFCNSLKGNWLSVDETKKVTRLLISMRSNTELKEAA